MLSAWRHHASPDQLGLVPGIRDARSRGARAPCGFLAFFLLCAYRRGTFLSRRQCPACADAGWGFGRDLGPDGRGFSLPVPGAQRWRTSSLAGWTQPPLLSLAEPRLATGASCMASPAGPCSTCCWLGVPPASWKGVHCLGGPSGGLLYGASDLRLFRPSSAAHRSTTRMLRVRNDSLAPASKVEHYPRLDNWLRPRHPAARVAARRRAPSP